MVATKASLSKSITKDLTNYNSQNSFGSRLRAKRISPLLGLIESVFQEHGCVNIIDIGGTETYWNIVPQHYFNDYNVRITIVNVPDGTDSPSDHGRFTFVKADGCDLANFETDTFHIAHSNSVVEHVGDWKRMVQFSTELKRVAQKYFVQTPNYWFPIEPHCMTPLFHWFPKPVRVWLVMKFELGHWPKATSVNMAMRMVERINLLDKNMFYELFHDARINTEKLLFIPKSFVAIKE